MSGNLHDARDGISNGELGIPEEVSVVSVKHEPGTSRDGYVCIEKQWRSLMVSLLFQSWVIHLHHLACAIYA